MMFHVRDDGMLMLNDIELGDDVYQDSIPVTITRSIRDYLWEQTQRAELLLPFDVSHEAGMTMLDVVARQACESYMNVLTPEERMQRHMDALVHLEDEAKDLEKRNEWRSMIAQSLLASLSGFKGPPRRDIDVFVDAVKEVRDDVREAIERNKEDYELEQEWVPIENVGV